MRNWRTVVLALALIGLIAFLLLACCPPRKTEGEVKIIKEKPWRKGTDFYYVAGKVKNTGKIAVKGVKVNYTFLDAGGRTIRDDWSYADIDVLQPGEVSTFQVELTLRDEVKRVKKYRLSLEWDKYTGKKGPLPGPKPIVKGKVGEAVKVGTATYTVTSVKKEPVIMMGFERKSQLGTFVIIEFTIVNTSDSTRRATLLMQDIIDSEGRKYHYSFSETSYLANAGGFSHPTLADAQPDTPAKFIIVFDVLKEAKDLQFFVKDFPITWPQKALIDLGI